MTVDEFQEGTYLVELRPSHELVIISSPPDEAGIFELREMSVVQLPLEAFELGIVDPNVVGDSNGVLLRIVLQQRDQEPASLYVREDPKGGVEAGFGQLGHGWHLLALSKINPTQLFGWNRFPSDWLLRYQVDMDDSSDDSAATLVEEFDPEAGRPVSVCVVQMVAIASDRRPSDLKSLHRSVDPDALDSLFDSKPARHREGVTRLSFEYSGYEVVITAEEAVTIELEETPGR